ncbi:MAG: hypothetical protein M1299_04345 [Firmicutes bacterium]|nr:hypothetical protein [Bacillota bacterium]MCL5039045.1 hypothetical protein [Bacillota bacterium]
MNVEDMVKNALNVLTSGGIFHIDRIDYDEKNFGNIYVVLSSNNQVDIRFIKDRGAFWCEVGQAGEWYFIEDVFTFIGVTVVNKSNDLIDFIAEMATLIKRNMPQIFQAFNTKNSKDTQIKIKALATKRAMGMFKQ